MRARTCDSTKQERTTKAPLPTSACFRGRRCRANTYISHVKDPQFLLLIWCSGAILLWTRESHIICGRYDPTIPPQKQKHHDGLPNYDRGRLGVSVEAQLAYIVYERNWPVDEDNSFPFIILVS